MIKMWRDLVPLVIKHWFIYCVKAAVAMVSLSPPPVFVLSNDSIDHLFSFPDGGEGYCVVSFPRDSLDGVTLKAFLLVSEGSAVKDDIGGALTVSFDARKVHVSVGGICIASQHRAINDTDRNCSSSSSSALVHHWIALDYRYGWIFVGDGQNIGRSSLLLATKWLAFAKQRGIQLGEEVQSAGNATADADNGATATEKQKGETEKMCLEGLIPFRHILFSLNAQSLSSSRRHSKRKKRENGKEKAKRKTKTALDISVRWITPPKSNDDCHNDDGDEGKNGDRFSCLSLFNQSPDKWKDSLQLKTICGVTCVTPLASNTALYAVIHHLLWRLSHTLSLQHLLGILPISSMHMTVCSLENKARTAAQARDSAHLRKLQHRLQCNSPVFVMVPCCIIQYGPAIVIEMRAADETQQERLMEWRLYALFGKGPYDEYHRRIASNYRFHISLCYTVLPLDSSAEARQELSAFIQHGNDLLGGLKAVEMAHAAVCSYEDMGCFTPVCF